MMRLVVTGFFFIIILSRFGVVVGTFTEGYTPFFNSCGPANTNDINLQSNLNDLFSNLTSKAKSTGFAQIAINSGTQNQFNGLIMCYADSSQQNCLYCLGMATKNATTICPASSNATHTYGWCFLRYSKDNFIGTATLDEKPNFYRNMNDVTISNTLNETVPQLFSSLRLQAMNSDSKYAYGNKRDPGMDQIIYGLVQCTKDLDPSDCGWCLQFAIGNLSTDDLKAETPPKGVRVSSPNCYIRYELYPLPLLTFNSLAPSPTPTPTPVLSPPSLAPNFSSGPSGTPQENARGLLKKILAASVATAAALLLAVGITWLWRRQSIATTKTDGEESTVPLDHQACTNLKCYSEFKIFQLETLTIATNNFSDENKLGEGGFGSVYKGSLIDGERVAVKRLSGSSRQGLAELKNEVDLLAKLKHRNLVQLLGCCIQQKEKLLCYEFLPNGSLDNFLYANEAIRREELNWQTRYRIIQGISRGLEYLHVESRFKIVHRDLKASNILLDIDMTPKISDFGLARLFNEDQTHKDTSIIAGTFGYMAPEYILHGTFSAKSDVYSFGVLLLEIVTGRKISSFANAELACSLISYVWQHMSKGKLDQLKDSSLDNACLEEVSKCIHIVLLCVQEDPTKRPNMEAISIMLDNNYSTTIPALPSSIQSSSMLPCYELNSISASQQNNE